MVGIQAARPERPLIIIHPSSTPPNGYMEANGSVLAVASYPWLFGKIGTAYNIGGEAAGFFRIPDFRGEAQMFCIAWKP